jgi:hypothetical protein
MYKRCGHGKLLTEPCGACDKMDKVGRHQIERLAEVEAKNAALVEALTDLLTLAGFHGDPLTEEVRNKARAALVRVGAADGEVE